jgi:hypothetical protein
VICRNKLSCLSQQEIILIKKKHLLKAFISWFSENRECSIVQYKLRKETDASKFCSLKVEFSGVASEITTIIYGRCHISVPVYYHGVFWDLLADFDVIPKRAPSCRYYCTLCRPEARKHYLSRKELFIAHSFEPFLQWINKNFISSQWICLFGSSEFGITWAKIVAEEDIEKNRAEEHFTYAFPIMKRQNA